MNKKEEEEEEYTIVKGNAVLWGLASTSVWGQRIFIACNKFNSNDDAIMAGLEDNQCYWAGDNHPIGYPVLLHVQLLRSTTLIAEILLLLKLCPSDIAEAIATFLPIRKTTISVFLPMGETRISAGL